MELKVVELLELKVVAIALVMVVADRLEVVAVALVMVVLNRSQVVHDGAHWCIITFI